MSEQARHQSQHQARLRDDLISTRQETPEGVFFVIKDPLAGRFFRVREPEHWLINQFNGVRSPAEISKRFSKEFNLQLPDGAVEAFIAKLDSLYFLETERAEHEAARVAHRASGDSERSLLSRMLFVKLTAFDPTKFLDWIISWYRPLHGPVLGVIVTGLLLSGIVLLAANITSFTHTFYEIFGLGTLFTVIVSLAIVIFVHELAHAVSCRMLGGEVRDVGFLLLYFQPCFYTNLSDAWLFTKKSHRLAVILAGPLVHAVLLSFALFLWRVTVVGTLVNQIAFLTSLVAFITLLFNFNPLIKLDGYYMLSDWLEIPNLRDKSFRFLGATLKRSLFGIPDSTNILKAPSARERKAFRWYAFLALLYSSALLGYLFTLAWRWSVSQFGFVGGLLLVALVLLMLRGEIIRAVLYLAKPMTVITNIFRSPVRGVLYLISLVGVGLLLFAAPFTQRVSGEVELIPLQRYTISISTGGRIQTELKTNGARPETKAGYLNMSSLDLSALIIEARVSSGDRVSVGDTLVALQSNQVTAELESARSSLNTLQSRLALLKSPPKADSLRALQADAKAIESEYNRAESELTRKKELFAKNLIARNELEVAESAVEVSKFRWESAQSTVRLFQSPPKPEEEAVILSDIRKQQSAISFLESQEAAQVILSPISGRVIAEHDSPALLEVINDLQIEAVVRVSDYDIEKVAVADPALLKVRSFPAVSFSGFVSRIGVVGESPKEYGSGGSFIVAILFDNAEAKLKPGMSGYAKIEVGQSSLFSLTLNKVGSLIRVEFWSLW